MRNNSFEITNDLLKFLLCELKERDMPISHYRIQKTVFKIKMGLGENHLLYENLPFYWYEHGPFSNVLASSFFNLTNKYKIKYHI